MESVDYSYSVPEESPGFLLWQVQMLWQRKLNQALTPFDLTHAQFILIKVLAGLEQEHAAVKQSELAARCHLDVMSTSKAIRLLEQKNLINRAASTTDARALLVSLTELGRLTVTEVTPIVVKADQNFFEGLGKDRRIAKFVRLNALLLQSHEQPEKPTTAKPTLKKAK